MTVAELITALDNPIEVVQVHMTDGEKLKWIKQWSFDEPYKPSNSAWAIFDELYGLPEYYHNCNVLHFRIYRLKEGYDNQAMDIFIEDLGDVSETFFKEH